MKKLILILMFAHSLFALNSLSAIPENQKILVSKVIKTLDLPATTHTRKVIFDKLEDFLTTGWSAHWTTNKTAAHSKIKDSQTQICDVTIYNNNRVVNCTFVYFKSQKQLFVTLKQYVEGKSKIILKLYESRKKDAQYSLRNETDNYAYFHKKGYMKYVTYHISAPAGMIVYESSYIINIK